MKTKSLKYSLIFSAMIFCFCKCHKKDTEPNPCASLKPTTADFKIREPVDKKQYPMWVDYYADTVTSTFSAVYITAVQDSTSGTTYLWEIGQSKITQRSFYFDFSTRGRDSVIPIKLTVKTIPNKSCFPADSGYATFTKNIVYIPWTSPLINGTYFGTWTDASPDTATIIVNINDNSGAGNFVKIDFQRNFNWLAEIDLVGSKEFVGNAGGIRGILTDNETLKLISIFYTNPTFTESKTRTFTGKRIK